MCAGAGIWRCEAASAGGVEPLDDDVLDAVWLCKVAERQMLRRSFVPPQPIRVLRDLTRYQIDLFGARTAEKSRVEKLLEDACINLSVVASAIRALEEAFAGLATGGFDHHHRFLLQQMLARIDGINADIAVLDTQIEAQLASFDQTVRRLDETPGIGPVAPAIIIAEIGVMRMPAYRRPMEPEGCGSPGEGPRRFLL